MIGRNLAADGTVPSAAYFLTLEKRRVDINNVHEKKKFGALSCLATRSLLSTDGGGR